MVVDQVPVVAVAVLYYTSIVFFFKSSARVLSKSLTKDRHGTVVHQSLTVLHQNHPDIVHTHPFHMLHPHKLNIY